MRKFGFPVTFGQCSGFVHDGGGSTGVVMLPAWGFEEMTIRRGWSGFANMLAEAGYCCLRFDWPGAGDSLGDTADGITLADWRRAATDAVAFLKTTLAVERVVLIGHGIGALLAPHVARELQAAGVVVMAPQSEGAIGIRELDVWSRLIGSFLRLPPKSSKDNIEVAGHAMSRALASEIAAVRYEPVAESLPVIPLLAVLRSSAGNAAEWTRRLGAAGFDVRVTDYPGWERFLAHSAASVPPVEEFQQVLAWLRSTTPPGTGHVRPDPSTGALAGDGFVEKPLLLGKDDLLFGVVCQPVGQPSRAIVVLANSGDNYHIGWGRMHVEFARALALQGISTLRLDSGGIGDAGDVGGHLFYVPRQIEELQAVTGLLDGMGLGPVLLSGRCSGAYASIQAAIDEPRVKGLVAVNSARLVIGSHETFEQVMSAGTSSMADYGRRAFSAGTVRDILTGRLPLRSVLAKASRIGETLLSMHFPRLAGLLTKSGRLSRTARRQAEILRERGVPVYLIYAENDGGLDELARHFGGRKPEEYRHAVVRVVKESEHNMTAPAARAAILSGIVDAVNDVTRRNNR